MADMTVVSIETTQAIQTFPPRVRLVARKMTVVRLMVRSNLGPNVVPIARARMRVIRASGPPSGWFDPANGTSPPAANPGVALLLKEAPNRSLTDDTFNFRVPAALCVGTVQWEFDVRIDPKFLPRGTSAEARLTQRSVPVKFYPRKALEIRYVRVAWPVPSPSGNGMTELLPSHDKCVAAITRGCQLLPTAQPIVSSVFGTTMPVNLDKGQSLVWDLLQRLSVFRQALDLMAATIADRSGDEIWCAVFDFPDYAIQGMTAISALDLVVGAARVPVAHEIGHCLRQDHLAANCPLIGPVADAEIEESFTGGALITDVPFDVIENQVVPLAPGNFHWDFMTYCQGENWVSVERWRRLWDEVGAPEATT